MKTEIAKTEQTVNEIDWSKPMLVESKSGNVIITDGKHNKDCFGGTVIYSIDRNDHVGVYINVWNKQNFTPITEPITIKFIP